MQHELSVSPKYMYHVIAEGQVDRVVPINRHEPYEYPADYGRFRRLVLVSPGVDHAEKLFVDILSVPQMRHGVRCGWYPMLPPAEKISEYILGIVYNIEVVLIFTNVLLHWTSGQPVVIHDLRESDYVFNSIKQQAA